MQKTNVMLVDHDQLFSAALAALLAEEGYGADSQHADLEDALEELAGPDAPEVVMVDPGCLAGDPLTALRRLRQALPEGRLIVMGAALGDEALRASLTAGADGHVSKAAAFDTVLRAVRLVMLGQAVFPSRALEIWEPGATHGATGSAATSELSRRETQILACVLGGQSNKAIARRLDITESTVKMHFKNVMRKIQASNRTQAAVWAIDHGIAPMAS
ncbi:response regulator transcription factor [Aerophototrophica crusticola]|uniref:Response regulator transcription factor n=1 Tax=Aerophototrophica crusticola TaxID=1709002 RepID=A0A858R6P7_9PROT|nr:response regulator transcription factor [Rhodospirillaceae bacterium B3]